jgi:hypothetical protein
MAIRILLHVAIIVPCVVIRDITDLIRLSESILRQIWIKSNTICVLCANRLSIGLSLKSTPNWEYQALVFPKLGMKFFNPDENSTQETKARKRREVTKLVLSSKLVLTRVSAPVLDLRSTPKVRVLHPSFVKFGDKRWDQTSFLT